jgi:hypothetical protein
MIGDMTALKSPPEGIRFIAKLMLVLYGIKFKAKEDSLNVFKKCKT